jgi:UDP-GlcNAc:undecaprenyl-phosphate GlcNAc-1-phosphate transferase
VHIGFLIVFAVSLGLALVLTPWVRRLGLRLDAVDRPGGRRRHHGAVPRSGGIALYLAFTIAVLLTVLLPEGALMPARTDPEEYTRLAGLLIGGAFIFLFGLYDDRREQGPLAQLFAQILAAAIAISFIIFIEFVNNPFTGERTPTFPMWLTVLVTLFWLLGMMNTMNWLDGLDGLAGGVTLIASAMVFLNATLRLDPPQTSLAPLPLALIGATLGFLVYNLRPGYVFMGSSGSYFLGYTLGALAIIGGAKIATVLLVMAIPVLDVAWQIISRVRRGRSPFRGDRGHLFFRLVDRGVSARRIVIAYYLICLLFGGLALLLPIPLYKLFALIVIGVATLVLFTLVPYPGG